MRLLTLVATILVGLRTPVICAHPPWTAWRGAEAGLTYWPEGKGGPAKIYLRYCRQTVSEIRMYVDVFAHELLHVEHPQWAHPRVYGTQHRYGAVVLAELRRQK